MHVKYETWVLGLDSICHAALMIMHTLGAAQRNIANFTVAARRHFSESKQEHEQPEIVVLLTSTEIL